MHSAAKHREDVQGTGRTCRASKQTKTVSVNKHLWKKKPECLQRVSFAWKWFALPKHHFLHCINSMCASLTLRCLVCNIEIILWELANMPFTVLGPLLLHPLYFRVLPQCTQHCNLNWRTRVHIICSQAYTVSFWGGQTFCFNEHLSLCLDGKEFKWFICNFHFVAIVLYYSDSRPVSVIFLTSTFWNISVMTTITSGWVVWQMCLWGN